MAEINTTRRPANKPGLYRHPQSGAEVFVTRHPKLGDAMADGVVAQGYVWVQDEMPKTLAKPKLINEVEDTSTDTK